jgi:hypothetical protein
MGAIDRTLKRWLVTLGIAGIIAGLGTLAPAELNRPVPPGQIKTAIPNGAVSGSACGTFAPIVRATLIDDIGGVKTYRVACQQGVTFEVSR